MHADPAEKAGCPFQAFKPIRTFEFMGPRHKAGDDGMGCGAEGGFLGAGMRLWSVNRVR